MRKKTTFRVVYEDPQLSFKDFNSLREAALFADSCYGFCKLSKIIDIDFTDIVEDLMKAFKDE